MIDFTTIQADPIPASVSLLQEEKLKLSTENQKLKLGIKVAIGIVVTCSVFYFAINHIKIEPYEKTRK